MARTTQECLNYIKQQPWYNSYKENIKQHSIVNSIEEINNRNLISDAFYFSNTIEGSNYWYIINTTILMMEVCICIKYQNIRMILLRI